MPSRDKRAITDESIRDSLPTEEPQVGYRGDVNMQYNLDTDPSLSRAFFNPEIGEALAKISDGIHDTRRIDNTLKFQKKANQYLLNEEYRIKEEEEVLKQQTNQAYLDYQAHTLAHLHSLIEETKRTPGVPLTFALNKYLEEANQLADENRKVGNIYLASLIQQNAADTYNNNYPTLASATANKFERETKFRLKNNDTFIANMIRYQSPSFSLDQGLMHIAKNHTQVDPLITTPDDYENFRSSVGDAYKAKIDALVHYGTNNNIDPDQVISGIEQVIAQGMAHHDKDLSNLKPGQIIEPGRYGTDVIVERIANEAETLYIRNQGEDLQKTVKSLGYAGAYYNEEGNLTLQEIRDVSITDDAIKYAQEAIANYNKNRKIDVELGVLDKFSELVDLDNLVKGKIADNDFIWSTDYFTYVDTLVPEIQKAAKAVLSSPNATASQIQKAQKILEYDMSYIRPTLAVKTGIRLLVNQGKTVEEAQKELREKIFDPLNLKFQLNPDYIPQQGDLNDLTLQIGDVTISLAPQENMFTPGAENIERLHYVKGLLNCFGPNSDLFKDGSRLALTSSPDTHKLSQLTKSYLGTPGNLITTNQNGEYVTNTEGINKLSDLIDTGFTSSGNITNGLATKAYTLDAILSPIYNTYKNLPNKAAQEAYLIALSSSPQLVSAVLSVMPSDPNSQKMRTMIATYALTTNSDLNRASLIKDYMSKSDTRYNWNNINAYVKNNNKSFKLESYDGDATARIRSVINKVGINPEYIGIAEQLGVDLIAATIFSGAGSFDMKDYEKILNEQFVNGQYANAVNFNTGKYLGFSQVGMKDIANIFPEIEKNLKGGVGYGTKVVAENGTSSNLHIVRPNGVKISMKDGKGGQTPFTVYNTVPIGADTNSVLKFDKNFVPFVNDLHAFTNENDPTVYNGGKINNAEKKYGVDKRQMSIDAMRYQNIASKQGYQDILKVYEKDPSKLNPEIFKQPVTKEQIAFVTGGKSIDDLVNRLTNEGLQKDSRDLIKNEITKNPNNITKYKGLLTDSEKHKLAYLQIANAYGTDKELGYTNLYIQGGQSKQPTVGSKIQIGGFGGTLTSNFGPRTNPVTKQQENHHGIDVDTNTANSACNGVVVAVNTNAKGFGTFIIVQDSQGKMYGYGHVSKANLPKVGQVVKQNEFLAYSADPSKEASGLTTGRHVHFEVRTGGNMAYKTDENGNIVMLHSNEENYASFFAAKTSPVNPFTLKVDQAAKKEKDAGTSQAEVFKAVGNIGINLGTEDDKRKDYKIAEQFYTKKFTEQEASLIKASSLYKNKTKESQIAFLYAMYLNTYNMLRQTENFPMSDAAYREQAWCMVLSDAKFTAKESVLVQGYGHQMKPVKGLEHLTGLELLYKYNANVEGIKNHNKRVTFYMDDPYKYDIIKRKIKNLRK